MRFVTITYRIADLRAKDVKDFYKIEQGDTRTDDERGLPKAMCGIIRLDLDNRLMRKLLQEALIDSMYEARQIIRDWDKARMKELHTMTVKDCKSHKAIYQAQKAIKDRMNYVDWCYGQLDVL